MGLVGGETNGLMKWQNLGGVVLRDDGIFLVCLWRKCRWSLIFIIRKTLHKNFTNTTKPFQIDSKLLRA
jgi:hypothetical protein